MFISDTCSKYHTVTSAAANLLARTATGDHLDRQGQPGRQPAVVRGQERHRPLQAQRLRARLLRFEAL